MRYSWLSPLPEHPLKIHPPNCPSPESLENGHEGCGLPCGCGRPPPPSPSFSAASLAVTLLWPLLPSRFPPSIATVKDWSTSSNPTSSGACGDVHAEGLFATSPEYKEDVEKSFIWLCNEEGRVQAAVASRRFLSKYGRYLSMYVPSSSLSASGRTLSYLVHLLSRRMISATE